MVLLSSRSPKRTNLWLSCVWNRAIRLASTIYLSLFNSKTPHILSFQVWFIIIRTTDMHLFCNTDTIFATSKHTAEVLPLKLSCWTSCFHVLSILIFLLCPYGQSQTSGQLYSKSPFTPLGMEVEHSLVSAYSVQWLVTNPFFSC